MQNATKKLLGVSAGSIDGNAETLLKEALISAESNGARVSLIRLEELHITSGPEQAQADDSGWFWNQLMEADGIIFSSPIYTRALPGRLKLIADKILGPNSDRAIIKLILDMRNKGQEPAVPFHVDERVMRPRVGAFIAVGGAILPHWQMLALPLMHGLTFSMQTAVIDHMIVGGAGTPGAVVLNDSAMKRASKLGIAVASQLGRTFEAAEYVGDSGLCPVCHLDIVQLKGKEVTCATCGAKGQLLSDSSIEWTDLNTSVISMKEKNSHYVEILDTASKLGKLNDQITKSIAKYKVYNPIVRPSDSKK
jgi:multimeric flavodoxin WrbA